MAERHRGRSEKATQEVSSVDLRVSKAGIKGLLGLSRPQL
jgi:hypothetical protein